MKLNYLELIVPKKRYNYYDKKMQILYTLTYGDRGVYGSGKAWYLKMQRNGANYDSIATFTVSSDGYRCEKEDYGNKIWESNDAIREADRIVAKLVEMITD